MDVLLANPRGFCAGVVRAVEIVERALAAHGPPIHVLHEIVHNRRVVEELRAKGAVFVERIEDVPRGAIVVFSAHGVPRAVARTAAARALRVIDATCPLVTKVQLQARRYRKQGRALVIVGHEGHPEVEGHRGQVDGPVHVVATPEDVAALEIDDASGVAYVTQTTLSLDDTRAVIEALERRFPGIRGPALDDICYATQNRQNAVRELARRIDVLLVIGARNSSNSNRLQEVGRSAGLDSYLIESAAALDPTWFRTRVRVGITAGASAPEVLVREVVEELRRLGVRSVEEVGGEVEDTVFAVPDVTRFEAVG